MTTEANIWMLHARDEKVAKAIAFLDRVRISKNWTDDDLIAVCDHMDDDGWKALADACEVRPLSAESRALVKERIASRLVVI